MTMKNLSVKTIILIVSIVKCHSAIIDGNVEELTRTEKEHHLSIRSPTLFSKPILLYGLNAATGVLVAIAIPLHDLDRNVFMSYNFEANYNMPNQPEDSYPGAPYIRWKLGSTYEDMSVNPAGDASPDDVIARSFDQANKTVESVTENIETTTKNLEPTESDDSEHNDIHKRSILDQVLLTRKGVYRAIEGRISIHGIDGKKCLLRAICESAQNSLLEANGILGHLLHIILTPSTSMDENLPSEYSKAENLGYKNDCRKYIKKCDFSLLDAVTKFV